MTSNPPVFPDNSHYPDWLFSGASRDHRYLVPAVLGALPPGDISVLDLGCGNGALTGQIHQAGKAVTGLDFVASGIERARASFPDVLFHIHDLNDPLPEALQGRFDVVVAAEVIEHLFLPRTLFARCREALGDRGQIVVTTPFHGLFKNLAIVLSGKSDDHWDPMADYGHVKFFSKKTLSAMARECGFEPISVVRAGRVPPLAATMVMRANLVR